MNPVSELCQFELVKVEKLNSDKMKSYGHEFVTRNRETKVELSSLK